MEFLKNTVQGLLDTLGGFTLDNLLPALILLVVGILVIAVVMKILKVTLAKSKLEKAAHQLIRSVVRIALYILLGLAVASALGIDITGVVALASVLTLAISLALQNALTNLIGGFTILYTKPFASGDFVDIGGQSGSVTEIGLTYTKLATADNKLVSIPNSTVTSAQIVNYTVTGTRRVEFLVSASYDSPVDTVLEALKEAAQVPAVLEDKPVFCAVKSYDDSAISYVVHIWTASADYWTAFYEVNRRIKMVFDEKGIEMTYPHLNVHLDK